MIVGVFVPVEGQLGFIAPRSGIVGVAYDHDHTYIYYEGNLYGSVNLNKYEERVARAADRLAERYPTIAKAVVPDEALVHIGDFDVEKNDLVVWDKEAYERWMNST
jgi:hypothetical protein